MAFIASSASALKIKKNTSAKCRPAVMTPAVMSAHASAGCAHREDPHVLDIRNALVGVILIHDIRKKMIAKKAQTGCAGRGGRADASACFPQKPHCIPGPLSPIICKSGNITGAPLAQRSRRQGAGDKPRR
jgi:hypothetical protein